LARITFFDIESTNLNANYGYCLCIAWKHLGESKIHCVSIDQSPKFKEDPTNDAHVVKTTAEALSQSDVVVGWYSQRFDWPFIQSRLLTHKLQVMPPIPHVDLWRTAKYQLKLNSNRLASVSEFLQLDEKTPIRSREWIRAMAGHKKSIKYVVDHCKQDIVVLEEAYYKLRPLIKQHPNVNVIDQDAAPACPVCGSEHIQKRGFSVASVSRTQRFHCQRCGAWSKGKAERLKELIVR